MKKLHIIFLDFDDIRNPLLGAGQAKATSEVGRRLVEKGHQVTVIASRYPGSRDRREKGIVYKHIGLGSKNIRLNNIIYILALSFTVAKLRADIIVECFTAPISTLCSPLWTKIPVVGLPTSFEAERFSKLYTFPFWMIEKFGLRLYKYALPYTKHFENKMRKENPDMVTKIVPEGVEESFFAIRQQKPEHILFLGRLDVGQKGIDLLLQAYKKIVDKVPYPLVIAGNGPDEEKVKQLIRHYGLEKHVTMTGPTYGKKKETLLVKSLFVAFSSRHEGFSLFSLEALASGLPLVGFDIPGLSWTRSDVAMKAPAYDVDAYAKLLHKAATGKTIYEMRRKARIFAKQYTWDNVAEQFEEFFTQIISFERSKTQSRTNASRLPMVARRIK